MKRLLLLLLAFLPLRPVLAQSLAEKLQFSAGTFLEFVPIRDPLTDQELFEFPLFYYTFSLGGQYVFWHSNDVLSLSANPSANLSLSFSNAGASIMAQVPAFVTLRVGANCTNFSELPVGFGVGIGGTFTYAQYQIGDEFGNTTTQNAAFVAPAAMAEVNFKFGGTPFSIRGHANLMQVRRELDLKDLGFADPYPFDYSNWGIGFMYYFR